MANEVPNKIEYGGRTLIDLTGDTATESDVAVGKTFHLASGVQSVGTRSRGYVTQDENGYIVLPPTGGGTPSGGLEYETGIWTPTEDIESYVISFSNTHTEAPFYYEISDATGTYDDTTNTNYRLSYTCWQKIFGEGMCPSSSQTNNGAINIIYRASNTTNFSSSNLVITQPYDATGSTAAYPRYWATEAGIKAYGNSTSRYWRAGRTYKWIAVWASAS